MGKINGFLSLKLSLFFSVTTAILFAQAFIYEFSFLLILFWFITSFLSYGLLKGSTIEEWRLYRLKYFDEDEIFCRVFSVFPFVAFFGIVLIQILEGKFKFAWDTPEDLISDQKTS